MWLKKLFGISYKGISSKGEAGKLAEDFESESDLLLSENHPLKLAACNFLNYLYLLK